MAPNSRCPSRSAQVRRPEATSTQNRKSRGPPALRRLRHRPIAPALMSMCPSCAGTYRCWKRSDHRDGGESNGAAAAGGERQQGTSASRQAGERHRVVAGRVHEHETRGRSDAFGKVVDLDQRRGAPFGHRAQRFLEDVAQPACLLPGDGLSSKPHAKRYSNIPGTPECGSVIFQPLVYCGPA